MNLKNLSRLLILVLTWCAFASVQSTAQTKQRFPLAPGRGEAGKAVAGTVKSAIVGTTYRDYFFYIPRGRSADVSLSTDSGETVKFDVISPQGKKLFENETEILDELPRKGTYIIRVYRSKDNAGKKGKSTFQLAVFMYI